MDSPNEAESDAHSWSIDQVVQELCYNPTPKWSPKDQPQLIPDRQLLENTLRQNHVDGDNLLALDMGVLRDDLGVMSFGQRRAILRAIDYFRLHSRSYQQMAFQADSIARMQPGTYTPQLSRHSMLPQSPAHAGLGLIPSIEPRHPTHSPSVYSNNFGFQQPSLPQDLSTFESKPPISEMPPSLTRRNPEIPSILPTIAHDTAAKKEESRPTAPEPRPVLPQRSKREYVVVNGRKKIAPTFLSPLHEGSVESCDGAYLSSTAVPLQDVFYHRISTGFGDVFYRPPVDESSDFLIGGRFSTGQRLGVASHMKQFLRQGTGKLASGAAYKIPYKDPGRAHEPYSEHYFTLFPQDSGRPRVFRAQDHPEIMGILNANRRARKGIIPPVYEETRGELGQEENSQWTDLDYLLEKYPVEASDEPLPAYGDSGDEGEFDEDTWREIQEEEAEKIRESSYMTRAEVDAAIDQTIKEMRQDWHETKRPKIQLKAWRMWMKAARKKGRQQELTYVRHQKQRFERMMLKTRKAIADDIWRNAIEVKKQCQSVEAAVHQYEEYQHYEAVLNQDTPPERPTERALRVSCGRPKQDLEEGEELIESETEPFTDEEDDFLVDDSSDVGSIHHEPDMEEWDPVIPPSSAAGGTGVKSAQPTPAPTEPIKVASILELREADSTPDPHENDADVETSEGEIITPARKRQTGYKAISPMRLKVPPKTPVRKHVLSIPADPSQPTAAGSESDSENSDFDRAPRLPKTRYRGRGRTQLEPVDLTFSSPTNGSPRSAIEESTDFSVHTPELNPAPKISPGLAEREREPDDDSGLPPYADVEGMRDVVEWSDLEKMIDSCVPDKRRALAKAVYELDPDTVIDLDRCLKSISPPDRKDILVSGLLVLSEEECEIEGVKPKHQPSAHLLVLLYITFVCGQNLVDGAHLTDRCCDDAYNDIDKALKPFFDLLDELIDLFKKYEQQSSSLPSIKRKRDQVDVKVDVLDDADLQMTDASTDFVAPEEPPSTHKKRKRMVEESQEAKSLQMSDRLRIQEQEDRRKKMAKKFAQMTAEGTTITEPVNTTEPYVYLHPHIAQRVKPHQLSGIQFMWREIIEDPKHQGCILAHTMGLGKTMQVVSLLVTIALCNQSEDPSIRNQIPSHLRKSKTLILCPASLVENWFDELLMWTPDVTVLGTIYKHDKPDPNIVAEWSRTGGVLLTGYERFRGAIEKNEKAKKQGNVQVDIGKILLEVPNLVIADEAHRLKNASSTINKVAKRLKTTSRIALTGSPLNNHLEEYHTMVDWIAPNYLGDIVQFKAKYSEPIKDGLWADSTAFERRVSLRKLHVLRRDLDPKITRADISAIAKDMPPKTEFFITLPLTDIQKQAYNIYVKYMLQTMRGQKDKSSRTANIWAWINMLGWLCHHPSCFLSKMQERADREREERAEQGRADNQTSADEAHGPNEHSDPITPENPEADHDFDISGPMEEALQEVKEIFKDMDQPTLIDDPSLSYRTQAVREIVRQTMVVGDKTLIFSHSIPTLNYIERMLENMNCSYCRLDGKTKMSARQAATKKFNQHGGYQVFLISMRAGGLGLNLQGANRVIIFDFSFNPTHEEQAIGRAYRLNQKTPVFVYRFQAGGTFEDVLFNTAIFKTQLFGRVVDKKRPTRHATKNMAEYLFPARDVPLQDFKDCLGKDPEVLDSVVDKLDFIRGIVLTETFQKEDDEQLNEEEQKKAEEEYRDEQLLRDNPAAYHAKKAAEQATYLHKQQQPVYPYPGRFSLLNQLPPSTAPAYPANSTFRPQSGTPPFPAAREDLDLPPVTLQPPSAPRGVPWAYDDLFRNLIEPDTGVGAGERSVDDGDVRMNGAE